MIVKSLKKVGSHYEVRIEDEVYSLDEETVVKYRLVKDKEFSENLLEEIQASSILEGYKKKALSYHLKYMKSSMEVVQYLKGKGIEQNLAMQAVEELISSKLINDRYLALQMSSALARNSNGPMLIRQKLRLHLFNSKLIEEAIGTLSEEDIELGKEKLLKKAEKKFVKFSEIDKKRKIRELFYRHGYEFS